MKKVVTVNTDASFSHQYFIATYAFWITLNEDTRIKRAGRLKEQVTRPEQGEIMAIVNALHVLYQQDLTGVHEIIVNTDCLNAIHVLTQNRKLMLRYRLTLLNGLYIRFKHTRELGGWSDIPIDFRHVRSHTAIDSKKSYVNDWCDREAKAVMSRALFDIKSVNFD